MKDKHKKMIIKLVVFAVGLSVNMANADIVVYWSLDDSDGSLARDSLGRGDGILKGNPEWAKGQFGGALKFDGSGDYVDCGGGRNSGDLSTWADITDTITVAAWVNITAVPTLWMAIVTKGDSAWRLLTNENKRKFAFAVTGHPQLQTVFGNIEVPAGEWQHVCGTYDGRKISLYVNGVLDGTKFYNGVMTTNAHNIYIGENEGATGRCFNGLIDDVVIFDHALSEDEITQLYNQGAASFVSEALAVLVDDVRRAKFIFKEQHPQKAVAFLEKKTVEYERWKGRLPNDIELHRRQLISDLYFLLARAKEGAGAQSRDVIAEYKKSVSISLGGPTYLPALLWLFENVPADDYVDTVRKSVHVDKYIPDNVCRIAQDFELSESWSPFKLFLDGAFAEVDQPASYAKAIAKGLNNDMWSNMFSEYCQSKPELTEYVFGEREKQAQEYIEQDEFSKAVKIYRDLASQCVSDRDRSAYELKVCECSFESGEYNRVLSELDDLLNNSRSVDRGSIVNAMLLKGQVYLQLSEIDRAYDIFSKIIREYPKTERALEVSFFIGYCNMLQSKYKEAAEALNTVVRNCPQDSYANKARLCLARIKRVTE